jgi:hypothetical protein
VSEHHPLAAGPPFGDSYVSMLWEDADETVRFLDKSWQRPVRHNRKIERIALRSASHLVGICERAIDPEHQPHVLPISPHDAPPAVRYEFETAIRAVPQNFPLTVTEAGLLNRPPTGTNNEWLSRVETPHELLLERWHTWLWPEEAGHDLPQGDHGEASLLSVAASRIAEHAPTILSWYRQGS